MGSSLLTLRNDGCVENYHPNPDINKLPTTIKEITFKPEGHQFQLHSQKHLSEQKIIIQLPKVVNNLSQFNLKRSKFVAEEQQSSAIPNKSRQDKIKRRVQNFKKIGKIVAAATPALS